jgi:hypothetical protein
MTSSDLETSLSSYVARIPTFWLAIILLTTAGLVFAALSVVAALFSNAPATSDEDSILARKRPQRKNSAAAPVTVGAGGSSEL